MLDDFFKDINVYYHLEKLPMLKQKMDLMSGWLSESQSSYSDKRKSEYIAGRYCAMQACKKMGYTLTELLMNEDRSPKWPAVIKGSISHSSDYAISVVSNTSVGVDIETLMDQKRFEKLKGILFSNSELALINSSPLIYPTIGFSIKESLYKALYPVCQTHFGFLDAEILKIDNNEFEVLLKSLKSQLKILNGIYSGRFVVFNNTVLCLININ